MTYVNMAFDNTLHIYTRTHVYTISLDLKSSVVFQSRVTYLGCEVVSSGQVFEAEEAVPLSRPPSAGVIVHDLRRRERSQHKRSNAN